MSDEIVRQGFRETSHVYGNFPQIDQSYEYWFADEMGAKPEDSVIMFVMNTTAKRIVSTRVNREVSAGSRELGSSAAAQIDDLLRSMLTDTKEGGGTSWED